MQKRSAKPLLLPLPLPLRRLIGPSIIMLGLGLGSGEVVLWPYLSSNYGMGIIWGAILGITFQFFMNMEIERYALARGESVFVGFARMSRWIPLWFLLSTFVPWIWPGIISSSAVIFGSVAGVTDTRLLAIVFLILIGLILSLGKVLYKTVETFQKVLIVVSVPTILALTIFLAKSHHWSALFNGIVGKGDGYLFLPAGISIASFLAAFAYAGAGGNLNLAQSFYIKEKGYGMGKFMGKITSLLYRGEKDISIYGFPFQKTTENIKRFKAWWKVVNIEHFLVFWVTGTVTILALSFLAYIMTYGMSVREGISFVLLEGEAIRSATIPFLGTFFLIIAGLTLFGTQLTIFDASSRILSENVLLLFPFLKGRHLSVVYYTVLWAQILAGILIFLNGFTEPLQLLTLAAVLNAFAMFIHCVMTLTLNLRILEKPIRPARWRVVVMGLAIFFYGGFSIFTLVRIVMQ